MLEFIVGKEDEVINNPDNTPATAFVIVESEKGYMLLYNKYYRRWEITGGWMEQGELPKECAIRECKEESNQTISNLKFIGVAKYPNLNAAIYYTFLNENEEKPFVENDEISECRWWKLGEEIVDLDVESMKLIELYNDSN